jgi:cardiolipin synthase
MLVDDGGLAFHGGSDTGNTSSSRSSPRGRHAARAAAGWRDTNVRIAGPLVAACERVFHASWEQQQGKPLPPVQAGALAPQASHIVRLA